MAVAHPVEPIVDDDAVLRAAAEHTDVPLLSALAQATGDPGLCRAGLTPDLSNPLDPLMGWTPEQLETARQLVFDTLVRWRDAGCPTAAPPGPDELRRMMEFAVGGALPDDYLPLLHEELGGDDGRDLRAPDWHRSEVAPDRPFRVAVVGAGMSGLLAAHRLEQAGVPYVVLEKNDDVGGTWLENTYPGCRVDVANHLYSYSFAQRDDWPQQFSAQQVLLDYFRACADEFGLRPRIRFRTEVLAADWSDESCSWRLQLATPDGPEELESQALVMAVGQLNRPHLPDIAGMDEFGGPSFHSARWDHGVDLAGRRVAVVGTGASAAQFVPVIAEQADRLLVFQRTPNWLAPVPHYQEDLPESKRWLFRHVPFYNQWYRFWLFYRSADGLLPATEVPPGGVGTDGSHGPLNDLLRAYLASYLHEQFAGRPELIDRVVPDYPPAAKRIILDNGSWARAVQRDNVELISDRIAQVAPDGIRMVDGTEHPVDVIIYGTGFRASHFLSPVAIRGRGGADIHDHWNGDARAYLGITVPGFPNLFCLYGPNTNIVVNGSIIFFSECEVRYLTGCLRLLLEGGHGAMDVRPEVHDAFNTAVDDGNARRVWGASSVNSWYKNARGRVSQNWPFTLQEYWRRTLRPDPTDFEFLAPAPAATVAG